MPYIALSTRSFPASAESETVFPFLFTDGVTFRFALLVADDNVLAQRALGVLGFVEDVVIDWPSALGLGDDWTFYCAAANGPLIEFDEASADTTRKLSTYCNPLTFGASGNVRIPTALHIATHAVPSGSLNDAFEQSALAFVRMGAGRGFRFAAADNTDDVAPAFELPLETGYVGQTSTNPAPSLPVRAVSFALVPNALSDSAQTGCRLQIEQVDVAGGANERLWFGSGAFQENPRGDLELEVELGAQPDLRLGAANLVSLALDQDVVVARFGADCAGFGLIADPLGSTTLVLTLKFQLLRGEGTLADAFLIPWVNRQTGGNFNLNYRMAFRITGDWPQRANSYLLTIKPNKPSAWDWQEFLLAAANDEWEYSLRERSRQRFSLSGMQWTLAAPFGDDLGGVNIEVRSDPTASPVGILEKIAGNDVALKLPFHLAVGLGDAQFDFDVELTYNLTRFRINAGTRNKLRLAAGRHDTPIQIVDLRLLAFALPTRERGVTDYDDGYVDFENRELVVRSCDGVTPGMVFLPGELDAGDLSTRVLLKLVPFDPETFPEPGANNVLLRINAQGVTARAIIDPQHSPTIYNGPGKPLKLQPQMEREGVHSEIVLIDNVWRGLTLFADVEVPGFDDLTALVALSVRQNRSEPPVIEATVDLDAASGDPIAHLSVGYLRFYLEDLRASMRWRVGTGDWDVSFVVDGSLALASKVTDSGGMEELRSQTAIQVRELDLMNLHKGPGEVALRLKPDTTVRFNCLDGMFAVSMSELSFRWGSEFVFRCEHASLQFNEPSSLSITVEAGGVELAFSGGNSVRFKTPRHIGLGITIGSAVSFYGAFTSIDDERGRYFSASGQVKIEQLQADVFVKIGKQRKQNGQLAPSVVLFGQAPYEVPLFAGVVAKRFGAGIGVNNRLTGFPESPDADAILPVVDRIDPTRDEGWEFVERNGFYLSIVGTILLAPNPGPPDTIYGYVAYLIVSIDLDLNVQAAGKVWLSSSITKVTEPANWLRPALAGAIAMSSRERIISAALESRNNPFVEANPTMSKIFDNGHVKVSFFMSPRLVDFHLQDLSYQEEFLDIQMLYQGSLRIAIFEGAMLVLMKYSITGHYETPGELKGGGGGFDGYGDINVSIDFGGILSGHGLAAYGDLDVSVSLEVQAYISVGFSMTVDLGFYEETWSWEERFDLFRTTLDLGLRGTAAFNERGEFGFEGSLSISVSICSFELSISPSISVNAGVINEVREKVRDFEARVDAARRELVGASRRSLALAASALGAGALAAGADERWLHVRLGDWHLLLPRSDAPWFAESFSPPPPGTPSPRPRFAGLVTKLIVRDGLGNVVATISPPWVSAWTNDPVQRPRAQACLVETTRRFDQLDIPATPLDNWTLKRDPRVESVCREYWTDVDAATRPDHALPVRFKSPDEILASDRLSEAFDSEFADLVEYLYWSARSLRLERHLGAEGKPSERWLRTRGVLIRRFFQARAAAKAKGGVDLPPEVAVWAPAGPDPASGEWFGLWFESSALTSWTSSHTLEIQRTTTAEDGTSTMVNYPAVPVQSLDDDAFDAARALTRTMAPRQEYVVEQAGSDQGRSDEIGRVEVKFPIRLEEEYVTSGAMAAVMEWEVWRQFPWETEPACIGGQLSPKIRWINDVDAEGTERHVALHEPYLFSDSFATRNRTLVQPGLVADATVVRYHVRPIRLTDADRPRTPPDADAEWMPVLVNIPPLDPLPAELIMIWPASSLLTSPSSSSPPSFFLATTMEDARGNRRLAPVALKLPSGGSRPLGVDDFELLAEEQIVGQAGFYGLGDDSSVRPNAPVSPSLKSVRSGLAAAPAQTIHGKIVTPVEFDGAKFHFTSAARSLLRSDRAYRFFVRPKGRATPKDEPQAYGLVRETPLFLTRNAPTQGSDGAWIDPPLVRSVSEIEFVPLEVLQRLEINDPVNVDELPLIVSVRPYDVSQADADPRSVRTQIGLEWNQSGALALSGPVGGIEIRIQDSDDSSVETRFTCESLHEGSFRLSRTDFRTPSAWRLTASAVNSRRGFPGTPSLSTAAVAANDIPKLLLDLDASSNPVLATLRRRIDEYLDTTIPADEAWWASRWAVAKNLLNAIADYRKSPLNLGDSEIVEVMAQVESLVHWHFTGIRIGGVDDGSQWTAETRRSAEAALVELLNVIREAQPVVPPPGTRYDEREFRRGFLDVDLAKQLAIVIRQRIAVHSDLATAADDNLPNREPASLSWLPGGDFFEATRAKVAAYLPELGPLDRCQQLLALFPAPDASSAIDNWAFRLLKRVDSSGNEVGLLKKLEDLAFLTEINDPGEPSARVKAAAGLVTQAKALNVALRLLRERFRNRGWRLVRRPHHVATRGAATGIEVATGLPQPQTTRFSDLFSDEVRLDASLALGSSEPSPDRELPALFNLWERMGFAIDFAAQDSFGQFVDANDLALEIEAARLDRDLPLCDLALVVGRESDSEHRGLAPDDPSNPSYYVGYSFVKLVIAPAEFVNTVAYSILKRRPDSSADDAVVAGNLAYLNAWFALRGIVFDEPPVDQYVRIGLTAAYLRYPVANGPIVTNRRIHRLPLESFDVRWRSVPLVDGWGRTEWTSTDRRGRRLSRPAARLVSRFEPLLRWANPSLPTPVWPSDRNVVLDLPRIVHADATRERIDQDLPQLLPVAVHPHPQDVVFSVTLPAVAMRSLANQISFVRTGYAGYTLAFRFDRYEHAQERVRWQPLMETMVFLDPDDELLDDRSPVRAALTPARALRPRLFSHERLVTLEDLPYFYQYALEARSQFDVATVGTPGPPLQLPNSFSLPALRDPRLIAGRLPESSGPTASDGGVSKTWTVSLLLTRTGDLLTPTELAASPPLLPLRVSVNDSSGAARALDVPPDRFVEPAMGYHLYSILAGGDGVDSCYVDVAELIMPWHVNYELPTNPSGPPRPLFRALSGQVSIAPADRRPVIECGLVAANSTEFAYRVVLRFTTKKLPGDDKHVWETEDSRRFRVSRGGQFSAFLGVRNV